MLHVSTSRQSRRRRDERVLARYVSEAAQRALRNKCRVSKEENPSLLP